MGETAGGARWCRRACASTSARRSPGFDPEAAQQLLAEAGYPEGRGLPVIEIMFNKEATHQVIAESVKDMWQRYLGARWSCSSIDRGTLRQKMQSLDYSVSRAGWYGDYNDPLTFLDMFMTAPEGGGGNNDTGFADAEYDGLIDAGHARVRRQRAGTNCCTGRRRS